ncbi:cysteine desulfurase family protein [Vulgatibacter incomptus]|uniref:Cysteine desulfurase n=1 Tax=Vulgatibacter incomptus TaxID=1391653 RepID=A0A0K1PAS4_9BACT|nr:aminotransferase class V-fold PLP-dependent enzyme [Vulgatibacter incomptus]AKU90643.1 Cysteine desulfurase [Vulgatibacter incomptus]
MPTELVGRAYFDWAAGAPLHPVAREAAERALALGAGNPSSVHAEGRAARRLLEEARERVARLAGCAPGDVIFTGSGSEANAAAILGARVRPGRLLLGAIEHPSLRIAAESLRAGSAEVEDLPVLPSGTIDIERARAAIAEGPVTAVAVQLANNETGAIQPIEALAAMARDVGAPLHCDAVQAAGKLDLAPWTARCASLALSAHKLGGLAGAGALVLRAGEERAALIPGHQERGRRGGTPALVAIAAFGAAADLAFRERESRASRLADRSSRLEEIVRAAGSEVRINASEVERVPGIVSATFPGVDGETLLVALDLAGIACSHGAACSTGAMDPSHVLLAMGLSADGARSTLRFSVGPDTSDDELALLRNALPAALAQASVARSR